MVAATTGAVLLGAVIATGMFFAARAADIGKEIQRSEILSALTGGQRTGKAATVMAILEPGKASTFLEYLNALAPAVVNLEILPQEQMDSFKALYSTAQEYGIDLKEFSSDHQGNFVQVNCVAGEEGQGDFFVGDLKRQAVFSQVELMEAKNVDLNTFTIKCVFKKENYGNHTKNSDWLHISP